MKSLNEWISISKRKFFIKKWKTTLYDGINTFSLSYRSLISFSWKPGVKVEFIFIEKTSSKTMSLHDWKNLDVDISKRAFFNKTTFYPTNYCSVHVYLNWWISLLTKWLVRINYVYINILYIYLLFYIYTYI